MQVTGAWPVLPPILCNSPDCALTDVRSLASLLRSQRNEIMYGGVRSLAAAHLLHLPVDSSPVANCCKLPEGHIRAGCRSHALITATTAAIAHVDDYQAALGLHDGRRL